MTFRRIEEITVGEIPSIYYSDLQVAVGTVPFGASNILYAAIRTHEREDLPVYVELFPRWREPDHLEYAGIDHDKFIASLHTAVLQSQMTFIGDEEFLYKTVSGLAEEILKK